MNESERNQFVKRAAVKNVAAMIAPEQWFDLSEQAMKQICVTAIDLAKELADQIDCIESAGDI